MSTQTLSEEDEEAEEKWMRALADKTQEQCSIKCVETSKCKYQTWVRKRHQVNFPESGGDCWLPIHMRVQKVCSSQKVLHAREVGRPPLPA